MVCLDMRNDYEIEVGRLKGALCPPSSSFCGEVVVEQLPNEKDCNIQLYCTDGLHCEKDSARMRHHGFQDGSQLHGGCIAFTEEVRKHELGSRFIGKSFGFDEHIGERIIPDVISCCYSCGETCDIDVNCVYDPCHRLFVQCQGGIHSLKGCCCKECKEAQTLQKRLEQSASLEV